MKKLLFLFSALLLISCSGDDNATTHYIKVVNSYDRVTFNQISLPGYSFNFSGADSQTFTLNDGMPSGLNDIRVTIAQTCSVGGADSSFDILVNFIEGKTTTLTVNRIVTCSPQITVTYD